MKVKSESEVAQSCPTLRDPMDCSPPGSSAHGICQARVLEGNPYTIHYTIETTHKSLRRVHPQRASNLTTPYLGDVITPRVPAMMYTQAVSVYSTLSSLGQSSGAADPLRQLSNMLPSTTPHVSPMAQTQCFQHQSHCCCLVTQSCLTLCDPMDCSTPGLPVPHPLPKFAQAHAHCFDDAIQPCHPLMPSSPPALNLSQHQGLFQ